MKKYIISTQTDHEEKKLSSMHPIEFYFHDFLKRKPTDNITIRIREITIGETIKTIERKGE